MSGPSSPAPTPYQPGNQAGADQSYQQGANTLASTASALQGQVNPAYSGVTSAVTNNPYYNTTQQYAGLTSNIAGNTVAPSQFGAAGSQNQYGDLASSIGGQIAGQNAAGAAPGVYNQGMGMANQVAGSGYQGIAQGLLGAEYAAGNQLLQTAYDPQQTLYNQQYQQMLDQQNAINSMNGVSTSPYGAGVTGQAAENFNTSWQNQQLARETQGLAGFTSALQGGVSDYSNVMNTGVNSYNSLASGAVSNYAGLTGAEANALSSLGNTAGNAYNTGSNLNTAGLGTLSTAGQVQNAAYLQQQQAILDALNAQTTGTNASLYGTNAATQAQGQYLGIGQQATAGALNAWQTQNQANQSAIGGIFSGIGSIAGASSGGGGTIGGDLIAAIPW